MFLKKIFPFVQWITDIKKTFTSDILAGISVAVVAIPQSLAYAQMAGLPAYYGLYACILPVSIAALWGSSAYLSTGTTVISSLLSFSTVSDLSNGDMTQFLVITSILTLMVGIFQLSFGILKLGWIVNYISYAVLMGFTNASVIIIFLSQLPKFFDINPSKYETLKFCSNGNLSICQTLQVFNHIDKANLETFLIGFISFVIMFIGGLKFKKFPMILLVVVIMIGYSKTFGYSGSLVGQIPYGLPKFQFPTFDLALLSQLTLPALILSLISYTNTVSIAKSIARMTNTKFDSDQELIGQGLANMSSSLTISGPVTGSFSRSAINFSNGAKTGFSSIVFSICTVLTLFLFTPYLYYLPQATLSAMIMVSVLSLLDIKEQWYLLHKFRRDGLVAWITFVSSMLFAPHFDYGIVVGIIFSLIFFLERTTNPPLRICNCGDKKTCTTNRVYFDSYPSNKHVVVVCLDNDVFFFNINNIKNQVLKNIKKDTHYVLFMMNGVNLMDLTAGEVLADLVDELNEKNVVALFSGIQKSVEHRMRNTHLTSVDKSHIFLHSNEALKWVNEKEG